MRHRTLTLALLLVAAAAAFVCPRLAATSAAPATSSAAPQQRRQPRSTRRRTPARPRTDYSDFKHSTPAHRKDSCDSCHKSPSDNWARVRAADSAFPDITDYPEHASCLNCHRAQFFNGARPAICSVCHNVVSPRAGGRFPFANPAAAFARSEKAKKSPGEFALIFPHDLHQDVMARVAPPAADARGVGFVRASFAQDAARKARPNGCTICHEPFMLHPGRPNAQEYDPARPTETLPDGLLMTTATGHDSCFNCHWQDGGEKPLASDCAGCHKLLTEPKPPARTKGKDADEQFAARAGITDPFLLRKLMRRDSATFSHGNESHAVIDCATCHTRIPAISTLDETTLKVPILSCGGGSGCHISAKPRKILNEEMDKRREDAAFRCTRCHFNLAGSPTVPNTHKAAVGFPLDK
jgi:hypothetical protein